MTDEQYELNPENFIQTQTNAKKPKGLINVNYNFEQQISTFTTTPTKKK